MRFAHQAARTPILWSSSFVVRHMADYVLRDVNDELWKRVKVKAAQDGKPIRTVILELLTKYAR